LQTVEITTGVWPPPQTNMLPSQIVLYKQVVFLCPGFWQLDLWMVAGGNNSNYVWISL